MNRFCATLGPEGLSLHQITGETGSLRLIDGCAVLWRGFIANRKALQQAYGLQGEEDLDQRIIIASYRRHGEALQQDLLGEYSILLLDTHLRQAVITHDALGLSPLFYTERGSSLLVASHLIDLMDVAGPETLDADYFASYMALGYVGTENTPFKGIKRVMPGLTLVWTEKTLRHIRSWDLAAVPDLELPSLADYEDRLRELMREGVETALDKEGATWVALSGGLDSSPIACLMAQAPAARVGAYSLLAPGYPEASEEPWIRDVVAHSGIAWHGVDIERIMPFSELPDGFLGEPSATVISAAHRRYFKTVFAQNNVRTVLTGDGGDVVLGTFTGPIPGHLADPLFRGKPLQAWRGFRDWVAKTHHQRSMTYWFLRAMLAPSFNHLRGLQIQSDAPLAAAPWISKAYASSMAMIERDRHRIAATRCRTPGQQQVWDTLWLGGLSMSISGATLCDHVVRTPLLYRPLVEFMQAIPWDVKLRPRCDRFLERRAMRGILPETVRKRVGKTVGTWPVVEGLRRSQGWIDLLCDRPRLPGLGIATADDWRKAVAQAALGQTFGDRYFLTGVAFEVWLQGYETWRAEHQARNRRNPDACGLIPMAA
jgi:asparagine synthase (glutamine-hydrolysing)